MLWLHFCIIGHEIKHKKNTYDRSKLLIVLLMPIKISNMVPSKFNCVCRDSILKPNDVNIKLCDSSFNSLTSIVNDSKSSFILRRRQDFAKSPPLLLSPVHTDKSKVENLQNCVAFSEYMNFKTVESELLLILIATNR